MSKIARVFTTKRTANHRLSFFCAAFHIATPFQGKDQRAIKIIVQELLPNSISIFLLYHLLPRNPPPLPRSRRSLASCCCWASVSPALRSSSDFKSSLCTAFIERLTLP